MNWSTETNLTSKHSTPSYGYGDAAIVADRNSDKVLIIAAAGSTSFPNSTSQNPIRIAKMVSEDGGKNFSNPTDITEQIYKLDESWQGLFAASGRIMQSRYVKVGDYNRLYLAILAKNTKDIDTKRNYVLYSDDFGETWKVLGDSESPVPGGDEAKLEELPNGNVVISSREAKGRYINIFTYDEDDPQYRSGTWESSKKMLQYSDSGQGTNGEILVVYAKEKKTDQYTHLILQTIPTAGGRKNVKIFYRAVDTNVSTVDQYISDWDKEHNSYLVKDGLSGYSSMTIQADGSLGILIEEDYVKDAGYDMVYKKLDIETITDGKYEGAFEGIGSAATPYVVETKEQLVAKETVYANEDVNWVSAIPVPSGISVTDATYDSVSIAWQSVGEGYEYSLRLNGQEVVITSETAWSFEGLQASSAYTIEISARKDGKVSLYSDPLFVNTTNPVPVMPSEHELNLRFEDVADHSATAVWNTVQGATYYELVLQDGTKLTSLTNAVYLTGLTENSVYTVTLTAGNSFGKSSSHSGSFTTIASESQDTPVISSPVISWPVVVSPMDDKSEVGSTDEEKEEVVESDQVDNDMVEEVTNPFKDIDHVWNKDQILELYQQGIIKGYSADEFGANDPVTRIQFAVMLVRAMGYETDKGYTGTFTDLNPHAWYMDEIASILEHGIAQGYDNNEFRPGIEISREQAAKMLYAILKKELGNIDISNETEFKDNGAIAVWAKDAVYVAKAKGIINGMPDGNYEPTRGLTRAEAVSMIYKLMNTVQ